MESQVRELLVEELKDAYSAEKQALRCMQKALRMASAPALREGIELHIEQTQTQIERVEQAMEKLQTRPGRKVCEAMRGLVEEAQHSIGEQDGKGPILDLVIVAGMQTDRALRDRRLRDRYRPGRSPGRAGGRRSADGDARGGEADRPQADRGHPAGDHACRDGRRRGGGDPPLVRSRPGQRPARRNVLYVALNFRLNSDGPHSWIARIPRSTARRWRIVKWAFWTRLSADSWVAPEEGDHQSKAS